jgi:low affinity Fe/Cu permease
MHLKMDEIIRAIHGANNSLIDLEDDDEEILEKITRRYRKLAEQARQHVEQGGPEHEAAAHEDLRAAERALDEAIGAIRRRKKPERR